MRLLRGGGGSGGEGSGQGPSGRPTFSPTHQPERRREARPRLPPSDLPPIPEKLYYRIGEVSELVGVEPHVLRYWEQEFQSIRPQKSKSGQRVYSRKDVEHLRRVRELLHERKFTIAGAKLALRGRGLEPRAPTDPAIVAERRAREALVEIRKEIEDLLSELDTPPR